MFEGCFQTLVSNETRLTSKANNNSDEQRGLFYFSVAFPRFHPSAFGTAAEGVCAAHPLSAPKIRDNNTRSPLGDVMYEGEEMGVFSFPRGNSLWKLLGASDIWTAAINSFQANYSGLDCRKH